MFSSHIICFLFSFFIGLSLFAQSSPPKPSVILQAVCWDRFASKNISYFPWGNYEEENATKINLDIGFSSPSYPFVYYGKSPLKFFEQMSVASSDVAEKNKNKLTEVGEFTFDSTEGITSDFLLLLLVDKQGAKFKTYPMSLKQENLPYESFNCYSQCRENLYLAYGEQKQVLAPGKYVRFKNIENQTSTEIQVFTRKEGKYTESMKEYIKVSKDRRGIIFFSPYRNRLKMKRYYINRSPIEEALGYGEHPFIAQIEEKSDENKTELLNSF